MLLRTFITHARPCFYLFSLTPSHCYHFDLYSLPFYQFRKTLLSHPFLLVSAFKDNPGNWTVAFCLPAAVPLTLTCVPVCLGPRLHPPTSPHNHKKAFPSGFKFYLPVPLKMGGKWRGCRQIGRLPNHRKPQMVSIKVSVLLAEWGHGVWRSFLKAPWKYPLTAISACHCVCVCWWVCKWLGSGFIRLQWCLDSRKSSTNRTEWYRNGQKAPLEFSELIFFLPHSCPLAPFQSLTHFSPCSPPLFAPLFISIARLSQPWLSHRPGVAPLIFHIPLFLLFRLFSKALWASGGKLLATDYSYMVISPCLAPLSVSLASLSSLFPFHYTFSILVDPLFFFWLPYCPIFLRFYFSLSFSNDTLFHP